MSNILWVKDLFINDRFITREEFNNTMRAGARNFMNYNLLRTVDLNKVTEMIDLTTMTKSLKYFFKKTPWGISKGKVSRNKSQR